MKRSPLKRKTALKRTGFTPKSRAPVNHRIIKDKTDRRLKSDYRPPNPKYSRRRNRQAQKHGYASYQAYLLSAAWRGFRLRALDAWELDGCLICGQQPVTMHHVTYVRLCQERFSDVIPLCVRHHEQVHVYHSHTGTGVTKIREALRSILNCPMSVVDLALKRWHEMLESES